MERRLPAAVILIFLVSRAIFFAFTTASEYRLYRDYGDAARHTSTAELYQSRDVEYPHLTVLFGSAVGIVADLLPAGVERLVQWRPNKSEWQYCSESPEVRLAGDRYEAALSLVLFVVDAACLLLVYLIARIAYPNEGTTPRMLRLGVYVVATGILGLILYDRQDMVVALAALVALYLLARGWSTFGYVVLAVGAAYKLVPALVLPIWVLAAAVVRAGPGATPGRYLRAVIWEAAIAGVILLAWPVLTYFFGGGERGFVFLTFHTVRGLQLEAPVAWPVMFIDTTTEIGHSYGSYNMRGPLADAVARPLKLAMLLSVALGVAITAKGFWRLVREPGVRPAPYASLIPQVVAGSLVVWLGFIFTNKVGSPQYLMWVAPLVPLLPLRTKSERIWTLLFGLTLGFTTAVFPCLYPFIIGERIKDDPPTWEGPILAYQFLLAARSVTLTITTCWLTVSLWRSPRTSLANRSA